MIIPLWIYFIASHKYASHGRTMSESDWKAPDPPLLFHEAKIDQGVSKYEKTGQIRELKQKSPLKTKRCFKMRLSHKFLISLNYWSEKANIETDV